MADRLTAISYDNVNLKQTYGLYVGKPSVSSPERDIDTYEIAGRNGALHSDNGRYKEVERVYTAVILGDANLRAARQFLVSRQDKYYSFFDGANEGAAYTIYGRFDGVFEPRQSADKSVATVRLRFVCRPEKYTVNGLMPQDISEVGSHTLTNPSNNLSKPLFEVDFPAGITTGTVTVSTNGEKAFKLTYTSGVAAKVFVDCDAQIAYYENGTSASGILSFVENFKPEFPELVAGENAVTVLKVGASNATVKITPRWWVI